MQQKFILWSQLGNLVSIGLVAFSVVALAATSSSAPIRTSASAPPALEAQNVVWNSPSQNAKGSMPLGNGEVVVNAWVEAKTGDLMLLIARTDALSENCRFLKLGRLRVHFDGNPLASAQDFYQEVKLREGVVEIKGGGLALKVFADARAHVLHIAGNSMKPIAATATVECWRNEVTDLLKEPPMYDANISKAPFPVQDSADVFLANAENAVCWYHRNEDSLAPKLWEQQSLTGLQGTFDALIHRTFGGKVSGEGFIADGSHSLKTKAARTSFDLRVATHSAQTQTVEQWKEALEREDQKSASSVEALARTQKWWSDFWGRSWIVVGGDPKQASAINGGYALQRYAQGFQGRGAYPIKFNGGFFYADDDHPDWRQWGSCYWWQNTRHMYHPMLACGDFDLMAPLWKMYGSVRPLAEARTKLYHGAEGAYFPENMSLLGTYAGFPYGWDRKGKKPSDVDCGYWKYAWNQGPELVALMLDHWDYTHDETLLKQQTLPMAESVLRYFDTRFKKDAAGKIVVDPTQAVETYWSGVVNDAPTVAGLISITRRLTHLPPGSTTESQAAFFSRMRAACPELPTEKVGDITQLAPAQKYHPGRSNIENPETYAIWPYREVCLARPENMAEAQAAYANRKNKGLALGWGYDGNGAALLGLSSEAMRIVKLHCANSNKAYRWPATWGPNFDWLPDQNHGGNLMEMMNLMLLQGESGGKILLLPAWPKDTDVSFKLHAPDRTIVECEVKDGKVVKLIVEPESRRKDVELCKPFERAKNE